MDKIKYGVHQTHCCIKHGCKYGAEDCPVVSGETKQDYICEWCFEDGVESVDKLETFYLDYKSMWNELKSKIQTDTANNRDLAWGFIYRGFQEWMQDIETKYKQK